VLASQQSVEASNLALERTAGSHALTKAAQRSVAQQTSPYGTDGHYFPERRAVKFPVGCLVVVAGLAGTVAHAQFGPTWHRTPTITVISRADRDPRLGLVEEAVAFWNRTLEDLGSGFRLGAVTRLVRPVPEEALQSLGEAVLAGSRGSVLVPRVFHDLPGDLIIVLAESDFVSFAGPFFGNSKRVVGIKGSQHPPLTLPNVARNVITHELGHAIGLGHNSDPTKLMCGRPASCRPGLFRSDEPRVFPLTDEEKHQLLAMYPAGWKPAGP
jgi:hypothetical protein